MVIALAGRRIDAPGTDSIRFPLTNLEQVKEGLKQFFISANPGFLVCAGACGADLLALEVAGKLGIRRKMVLPFEPALFRQLSVTDRPGDWGSLFDKLYNEIKSEGDVVVLGYLEDDPEAYDKTNLEILNEAEELNKRYYPGSVIVGLIVWDGVPKNKGDATNHFKEEAQQRQMKIHEINTLQ